MQNYVNLFKGKTDIEIAAIMNNWNHKEKQSYIRYSISTHSGKMKGIRSISTSCLCNPNCIARMKNHDSICSHCFSASLQEFRTSLKEKLHLNSVFYSTVELTFSDVPYLKDDVFRFESFGDLINETHFRNFETIAIVNGNTNFTLWTKQKHILQKIHQQKKFGVYSYPKNLRVIYSSNLLNKVDEYIPTIAIAQFTVFDDGHFDNEQEFFICKKSCQECGFCYRYLHSLSFPIGKTIGIREHLK